MERAVLIIASASVSMACGQSRAEGWHVLHASLADGFILAKAHRVDHEIWAVGTDERPEDFPTATIYFDGDDWSRSDLDLPFVRLVITARDSFWKSESGELLHSSDGVSWARSDVVSDTGTPIDAVRSIFGGEGALWIFADVETDVALLRREGDRWIDRTPARLVAPVYGVEGCQRADDDAWIIATFVMGDNEEVWANHWNGSTWEVVELPPGRPEDLFCRTDDLWLTTYDPDAFLDVGDHLHHRMGRDWIEVGFPGDAFRTFKGAAEDGAPGGLWIVGSTYDNARESVTTVTPHIWRVVQGEAQETLDGDLGLEVLEPYASTRTSGLWTAVHSANGRTFALGKDGVILEYAGD